MLLPFLPRNPQRLAKLSSLPTTPFGTFNELSDRSLVLDSVDLDLISRPLDTVDAPPKMVETEECAHLECFRMAEVTVMHSVVMRATGSTAIATLEDWCILGPFVVGNHLVNQRCGFDSRLFDDSD